MSGETIRVVGPVGRTVLAPWFGSVGSGRREGGGESQCTDENSESAIAGEKWIRRCAFVRLLRTSLLDVYQRQGQERVEDNAVPCDSF